MAKRNKGGKMQAVQMRKSDKERMRIRISAEDQLMMDRAARREAELDSGVFFRGGVHGGSKNQQHRRDRRQGRRECRSYEKGKGDD